VLDEKGKRIVVTSDSIRDGANSAFVDNNGVEVTTALKRIRGVYFDILKA